MVSFSSGIESSSCLLWWDLVPSTPSIRMQDLLPSALPIISVSKGIELSSGQLMSDLIPSVLGRKQPVVYLSGPSFAKEVMDNKPTGVVAASKVGRGAPAGLPEPHDQMPFVAIVRLDCEKFGRLGAKTLWSVMPLRPKAWAFG